MDLFLSGPQIARKLVMQQDAVNLVLQSKHLTKRNPLQAQVMVLGNAPLILHPLQAQVMVLGNAPLILQPMNL